MSPHTGRTTSSPKFYESLRNVGAWRWIALPVSALCSPSIPSEVQKSPENLHRESKSSNPAFILCKSLVCKILPSKNWTWNPSPLLLFVPSANLTHWEISIIFIILFHESKFFSLSQFFLILCFHLEYFYTLLWKDVRRSHLPQQSEVCSHCYYVRGLQSYSLPEGLAKRSSVLPDPEACFLLKQPLRSLSSVY